MRICYLSYTSIPSRAANSVHIMKMCEAFAKNGHEVRLYFPEGLNFEHGVKNPYSFYGVKENFIIKRISCFNLIPEKYSQPILLSYLNSGINRLFYGYKIALLAKKFKADIVWGRDEMACFWSVMLGMRTVYEAHHIFLRENSNFFEWHYYDIIFKRLFRNKYFLRLIFNSEGLKRAYLKNYKINTNKLLVAPNAAAAGPIPNTPLVFEKSDKFQVGYIGHLYPGRGMEIILSLSEKCPWAIFHIIGGENSDILFWKKKMKNKNVIFHGFIPPSNIRKYSHSFDVLLAPYQRKVSIRSGRDTTRWMSPIKIFEYMSFAKPIICSDLPAIREILVPNQTALFCEPDNITRWMDALIRLKEDTALRNRLGRNVYREFIKHFTWKARAEKVLKNLC